MSQPLDYATSGSRRALHFGRGLFGWLLFIVLAILLFVWLKQSGTAQPAVPLSTLYAEIHKGNVARVVVDGDELVVTFRTNTIINGMTANAFRTALPPGMSGSWGFMQWLLDNSGAEVRIEPVNNLLVNLLLPLVPWLLILGFIWFFVFRQFRNVARTRQQPMRVVVVNQEEA